jgi:hypothetical protein
MKSVTVNNLTFNVGNIVKYKYDNGGFFVVLLTQIYQTSDNNNMFRCLVLYDEAKHFREKPGTILRGHFNHFIPEKIEIIT